MGSREDQGHREGTIVSNPAKKVESAAWSVPEGWTAERIGRCTRCHDTVLFATAGQGTVLKFDRSGEDHFFTCTNAPRQGVSRSWRGQHRGAKQWETD